MFGLERLFKKKEPDVPVFYDPTPQDEHQLVPVVAVTDLPDRNTRLSWDDGTKYPGGYGPTDLLTLDYWTLRARSTELFERNLYARGLIRRLVVNEINTGLHLEAVPEEKILGLEEDSLSEWSEEVENRFRLWADEPALCDQEERHTFGALQFQARMEALIAGDVLVVMQQDRRTLLPRLRLINGSRIQTPVNKVFSSGGNDVKHGVEVDAQGRHVAFWVTQDDGSSKRLPAYGEKSGRRIAWLVYGTLKRHDQVRGKPLLSLVLQSLKEIDRYRDSIQRKATINAMLAAFIKKGEPKPGTQQLTAGGAIRRGATHTVLDGSGKERSFQIAENHPGIVLQELQHGEEPVAFQSHLATEKFSEFESAIIYAIAWANGIPPEIYTLTFQNNYSASQAAINEFKMELNWTRTDFGNQFCRPVYVDWLISQTLARKIEAPGFLESWRDFSQHDTFTSWVSCDWSGHIKPAVDLSKLVNGYVVMVEQGFITRARAARELTGTRYSKNIQQLARENQQLADALVRLGANIEPTSSARESVEQSSSEDPNDEDEQEKEAA